MGFGTPSLKGKALQWLAQREHSRAELQGKLLRHAAKTQRKAAQTAASPAAGPTFEQEDGPAHQADITRVLDELAAAGLQCDSRAAASLARTKSSRYGVHRLKQQLQAKGLAADLVAQTVGAARDTEFERAREIWRRRYGEPAQDMAQRARQMRFLIARGFDSDVVRRVVGGAAHSD